MPVDTSMVDLVSLIEMRTPIRFGKAAGNGTKRTVKGPCPFCKQGTDRFAIFIADMPQHYYCGIHGNGCGAHGDAITFLQEWEGLSFHAACEELGVEPGSQYDHTAPVRVDRPTDAPAKAWQDQASCLIDRAQECLWSPRIGSDALAYLRGRGFADDTIMGAKLGYLPPLDAKTGRWAFNSFEMWGLKAEDYRDSDRVWLPSGILIPWLSSDGDIVWKLNIRRLDPNLKPGEKRYLQILGSKPSLYNVSAIRPDRPIILTEGELDAITGIQACGNDRVVFVATGSTSGGRDALWIAHINKAPYVLIAFDYDKNDAGDKGALFWQTALHHSFRWLPFAHDLNDAHRQGLDIQTWAALGIEAYELECSRSKPEPKQPAPVMSPIIDLAGFVPFLRVVTPVGAGQLWDYSPVRHRPNGETCVAVLLDKPVHPSGRRLEYFEPDEVLASSLPEPAEQAAHRGSAQET